MATRSFDFRAGTRKAGMENGAGASEGPQETCHCRSTAMADGHLHGGPRDGESSRSASGEPPAVLVVDDSGGRYG